MTFEFVQLNYTSARVVQLIFIKWQLTCFHNLLLFV